jgi:flagellar hook-associated protein 3 FlgL
MRVTPNIYADQLVNQISTLNQAINKKQIAVSTGKRIQTASDDPAAFRRSIEAQSSQRQTQEYRKAVREITARMEANHQGATQLQTLVSRASEIAIRATGILTQSDMAALAVEMDNLLEQSVALGNRQLEGQFLFGGTYLQPTDTDPATGAPYVPYSVTRNAQGQITAVTYRGNTKLNPVEIEKGSTMAENVVGSSTTGTPRGLFVNSTTDVFSTLVTVRDQLLAGTSGVVLNPGVSNIKNVLDNVAVTIGAVSANLNRLNLAEKSHMKSLEADEAVISRSADTDLAETIVSLQQKQTSLEAALQTGAQILNLSLLNYLR